MLLGAFVATFFVVVASALTPVGDGVAPFHSGELPPQRQAPSSLSAAAKDDDGGLSELMLVAGGSVGDRLLELGAQRPPALLPASVRHLGRRQQQQRRLPQPIVDRGETAAMEDEPSWDLFTFRYKGGEGSYQYTFDVSLPPTLVDGSESDAVRDATLLLYKDHAPAAAAAANAAAGSSSSSPTEPVLLAAYQLVPGGGRRLVGSAVVSISGPAGWVRFDVTEAVRGWVVEHSRRLASGESVSDAAAGLRLAVDIASSSVSAVNVTELVSFDVRSPRRRPLLDVRLFRRTLRVDDESGGGIGAVDDRGAGVDDESGGGIGAVDDRGAGGQRLMRRGAPPTGQPASTLSQSETRRRHMYRHASEQRQPPPPQRPCASGRCCRKHIYVSFKKLRWDWIVDPPGFDAYYCEGRCSRKFEPDTNFGFLKKALRAHNIANLTNTCAATKYSPLVVWHRDAHGYLVQTVKEDIIVERCGCA